MPITKLLYSFIENGPLTGSLFGTASYALDSVYSASLASRSNILESASSSFSTRVTNLVTDSGSFSTRAATLEIASGSFSTRITNLVSDSGSFSTRITNLVTDSSSFSTRTATLETASGSFSTRVTNLVSDSSSFSARLSSYTGSIFGTASYATKAETLVSGININAGLITASAISVTTLNVVTITSSIEYSSGSSVFGTKSTDTQKFTGSVSITGSLTVNGTVTATSSYSSLAATASYFAGVTNGTTNYVAKFTSANVLGTSSLFESGSLVGLNTTASAWSAGWGALQINSNGAGIYGVSTQGGFLQNTYFNGSNWTNTVNGASSRYTLDNGSHFWYISPSGTANVTTVFTQSMTLDSSGNLGIGSTTPNTDKLVPGLVIGNGTDNKGITLYGSGSAQQNIAFCRTAGTQKGLLQYDHSVDAMRFFTGGSERVRIDVSGSVGIGVTPSAWGSSFAGFQLGGSTSIWTDKTAGLRTFFGTNYYFDGTNRRYLATGAASEYLQATDGAHVWYNVASGTAGNTISFTERMRIDSSGNVGIGVSPSYRLQVFSGGTSTTAYFSSTSTTAYSATAYNGGAARVFIVGGNATGSANGIQFSTTASNEAFFGVVQESGGAGAFVFQGYTGAAYTERMRIDSSGNVGIGATTVAGVDNRLRVVGGSDGNSGISMGCSATDRPTLGFRVADNSQRAKIELNDANGSGGDRLGLFAFSSGVLSEVMSLRGGGNVGIGTTSPANKLDVAGGINCTSFAQSSSSNGASTITCTSSTGYAALRAINNASTEFEFGVRGSATAAYGDLVASDGYLYKSGAIMIMANGGNVKIAGGGSTTIGTFSSSGLAVAGAITATGNITAYFSDDRLKTKLGKIENALEKICSLDGFYYEANDLAQSLGYKAVREVGISAQSVQSVLPEIVAPAPIDSKYLTIHYERTVPLIIEAIKELRNEIAALKK